MKKFSLFLVLITIINIQLTAQELVRYQTPPKELLDLIDAPATPIFSLSPNKQFYLLAYPKEMPDLAELAQPELKIAGLRINPNNYGNSNNRSYTKLELIDFKTNTTTQITGIPEKGTITSFRWSPNGQLLAMSVYYPNTIELWIASISNGIAKKLATNLNESIISPGFQWMSDNRSLLYVSTCDGLKKVDPNEIPLGPSVQQSSGKKTNARTYQDLLKKPSDEFQFEYYCTSQLNSVTITGESFQLGNRGIYTDFEASPDGNYILTEQVVRPYSYLVPYYLFPTNFQIWNSKGSLVKRLAELPLADDIAQGFDAARKGRRAFFWRSDKPSTIVWVEAQDDGDPNKESNVRDALFSLSAPFRDNPTKLVELTNRFASIDWGWENFAIVHSRWWSTRKSVATAINPDQPNQNPRLLWDRSYEDNYNDPGRFVSETNIWGQRVLVIDKTKKKLYLTGTGASEQGDTPFLDEYNIEKGKSKRIWQSKAPHYQYFVSFINLSDLSFVISNESVTDQPNFFAYQLKKKASTQITNFPDPYPSLKDVTKEVIRYKRSDGIQLTGTLYLPANYKKGEQTLPTLMWAYPQEFINAKHAGQIKGSPYRFIRPSRLSAVLWVARGYAVFDNISMPIVAKDGQEANDTFIEQLVDNAKSAIDTLVKMGITDPKRVAIGGHSYGAFMTANLMAHSDLFAAGIARSGAYNRTLTPFGFQNEERTYWQAPEVYNAMSPFMHADKINEPLLLIHGENDNNSGTFPLQSERLYAAIKGHGGTARLVLLPYESHGYKARQSILHSIWEMDNWLETYLNNQQSK
ncbi:MAG: prolyl oligopeptidase family serine peptidase [Bacteroidales bacterium]